MPKKVFNKKRPKKARRAPIAKLVKQILNKNTETKMASVQFNTTAFNSSIIALSDFNQILPSISQGSVQNARTGVMIQPVKLVIRGYIAYKTDNNAGARMIGTRLFCFSDKSVSAYNTALSAGVNYQLLDVGGVASNYTGSALDFMKPHNSDLFKFYADKKHTIIKPYGLTNTLSPTASTDLTGVDKSLFKPFTITIKASQMPKTLKYDDGISSSYPLNFAPWLAVGYSDLMGYGADTTNTQIMMEYVSTLYYKDC